MTKEQFEIILGAVADKIKSQGEEIALQRWQIESLNKQVQEAEAFLLEKQTQNIS